ncbi:DUF4442 domain-containing protein [Inhella gelatinilytica]|uniref:DUF4442 domain-containing protein n=1 Tax=Inhella gelatinilytica TaxID=2795030 RepID=A0A931IX79_9BURK|nr:DUF4442 domain-containing protein [Inhella gelatinilytica]MBH9552313.1 DUF4442 domain-containing protein [Inhella gelatinilytica]
MARLIGRFNRLPGGVARVARNWALHRAVPLTGTAALNFLELTPERCRVSVPNRKPVQNHIKGVHAAAMTLVAETATGMVVGMNVRDDCLPLCKGLRVRFRKLSQGALTAVAHLEPEQRELLSRETKGEVNVAVTVTDEAGEQPIECEFVWAWVPKKPQAPAA